LLHRSSALAFATQDGLNASSEAPRLNSGVFKEAETGRLAGAVERATAASSMDWVHVKLASARLDARVERTAAPGRA
jgi:hypothetical protein